MYGLPQAGLIINKLLANDSKTTFFQTKHTPGLCHHKIRPIKDSLVVNCFVIQYTNKEDAIYQIDTHNEKYEAVAEDWNVNIF